MTDSPESPVERTRSLPEKNISEETDTDTDNEKPLSGEQKSQTRSEAINLIRARTLVRMSPPASSPENSPVKPGPESPGRSGVKVSSPKRSPSAKCSPGKFSPAKASGGSPRKPPKKSPQKEAGKSPESPLKESPPGPSAIKPLVSRNGGPHDLNNRQPGQLFQNPVPNLEPYLAQKANNPPSGEHSPSSSTSEPVYSYPSFGFQTHPHLLNAQSSTMDQGSASHAFASPSNAFPITNPLVLVPYTGIPALAQTGPNIQFGSFFIPQAPSSYTDAAFSGSEREANPESYDRSQAMSEWGSPEMAAIQQPPLTNEGNIADQAASLSLQAEENSANDTLEAPGPQLSGARSTAAIKTKLPTIQEAHNVTGSPSTVENKEPQAAPVTEEPSLSSYAKPVDSTPAFTHRPRHSSSVSTQPSPNSRPGVLRQKPEGFIWQLDSHSFPCAAAGCDQRCNLWDGSTVICPKCGPYSEIRYCSKNHLLEDVIWHWVYCGHMTFTHPCKENSIPAGVRNGPPLIPSLQPCDTPERHRQAVYFNTCGEQGDYFIFSDLPDMLETGFLENGPLRCSSRLIHAVVFEDPVHKDRFRRVLAACLFFTIEVVDLVDYMYRLIRDNLRAKTAWTKELEEALKCQLAKELSVQIQPHITGERHACRSDWEGLSRRACRDMTCRAEYRRLLGKLGGMGHRRLVSYLEDGHWVLRAVRTTHPGVSPVGARMRGEGFEGVLEEDRRKFCRGAGWDGAGSGDMEIEGANV